MLLKITGLLLSVLLFILPAVRCSVEGQEDRSEKNEDKNSSYSEKSDKAQENENKNDDKKDNGDKESSDIKDNPEENNNTEDEEKESGNTKNKKDSITIKSNINHWLPTIKKTEPKDSEGLAYIFDESFTLPIDFSKIDGEGQYYDEIREATTSDYMVTDSYPIYPEDGIHMPGIWFKNHSDEKISLSKCYENNWWCFSTSLYETESLRGIFEPEISNKPIWDDFQNTSPALEALMEKIGSPTRVSITRAVINENKSREFKSREYSMIEYSLIWENTDYVLVVAATEFCLPDDDYLNLEIGSVGYYTPEEWEYNKVYYDNNSYNEYIIE
ncbi:MAG: hypothetical protein UD936_03425 [Acutalibacteraceae bacterium]|nr:hypothetical protein [Acutalibacteraceae bacterium]